MELVLSKAGKGRTNYLLERGLELAEQGKDVKIYSNEATAEKLFDELQEHPKSSLASKVNIFGTADVSVTVDSVIKGETNPNTVIIVPTNHQVAKQVLAYSSESMAKLPLVLGVQVAPESSIEGIIRYDDVNAYQVIQNEFSPIAGVEGKQVGQSFTTMTTPPTRTGQMLAVKSEQAKARHEANAKIQGGSAISTDFFKKD